MPTETPEETAEALQPEETTDKMAGREKYWSEIDSQGKIERLRTEVKNLLRRNVELARTINKLTDHDHGKDGKPVSRIRDELHDIFYDGREKPASDEVYI